MVGGQPSDQTVNEYIFKVVVVGDHGAGKTTLMNAWSSLVDSEGAEFRTLQHVPNRSDVGPSEPTVGVDFSSVLLKNCDESMSRRVDARLQFWDIAATEFSTAVGESSRRNAAGAVIVCNTTSVSSVSAVCDQWMPWLRAAKIPPERIVVVVNRTADSAARDHRFDGIPRAHVHCVDCRNNRGTAPVLAFVATALLDAFQERDVRPEVAQPTQRPSTLPVESKQETKDRSVSDHEASASDAAEQAPAEAVVAPPRVVRVDDSTDSVDVTSSGTARTPDRQRSRKNKTKQKSGPCCC
uniref:Uncharacterized protein n=1 Tax=Neobodo designis TaxID=312471 RepID=A0A7S1QC33_NEODS